MKTCILSALVAAVAMAEGSADSPTMQSSQELTRGDMAAFRDRRPSYPLYIYSPRYNFALRPDMASYVGSSIFKANIKRQDDVKVGHNTFGQGAAKDGSSA
ncbi:unnamed protein product [Aphanomyces euteiches]|nr:hypothetical protein Ae201684P_020062 [Aphanomyces euteiches]KAH9132311.1 hypothetical protein LEN26_007445 [Aphanomyces euteiches]KAH9186190.1 hypothetical protein AeNC1_011834 [Aphanomyces euteiches]